MKKALHQWTPDEEMYVRLHYRGTNESVAVMAHHLGVTFFSVKGKVQTLGVAVRKKQPNWTFEDDEQLAELANTMPGPRIAVKIGRSPNAVAIRLTRLGISRRTRDGWYTKAEVCEIVARDHHWVQARIDAGQLKASYHNGRRPSRTGLSMWHIARDDLREFLRRYPHELEGRNVDLTTIVDILAGLQPVSRR